jgi:hypothetical protein
MLAGLSDEQKKAALHILNSRDTMTGVVGKAGTGKTTMMRATRDALESEPGRHVYAFAPSAQASHNVLAKEGFKDAETLAMLLKSEKLQEKTKGQILWVDEAGLVSSKDMRALMDIERKTATASSYPEIRFRPPISSNGTCLHPVAGKWRRCMSIPNTMSAMPLPAPASVSRPWN